MTALAGPEATRALDAIARDFGITHPGDRNITSATSDYDGPPEGVVAGADQEWFSDRAEARDERVFWKGWA